MVGQQSAKLCIQLSAPELGPFPLFYPLVGVPMALVGMSPTLVQKLTRVAMTRKAATTVRWLATTLAGVLLCWGAYSLGFTQGLLEGGPQYKVDMKCRFGAQALLGENLRYIEDEMDTLRFVYMTKPAYPPDPNYEVNLDPTTKQRMDALVARKSEYERQLVKIREACEAALAEANK